MIRMPWTILREKGIVGMNMRNADFIGRYNERKYYPIVDDKRQTKKAALKAGIPVPELYGMIETEHDIRNFESIVADREDFVIKPANGSGGNGIVVIAGRGHNGMYRKANDSLVSTAEMHHHISNILSGMHSLGGSADAAIIEYRVKFDPVFEHISFRGVPDIRTVVFRGIPVMAMVRLPTRESDGRANLHQGAVGAGVDLETGRTRRGVWKNMIVETHPDTGTSIGGHEIPHWEKILLMASRCYEIAKLGYMGVDIVLDRERGPMMLEINARPGLNIQLSNREGLAPMLEQISQLDSIPDSAEERVRVSMEFAHRRREQALRKKK
jgi:alpha-L-glutamate ligase-like protein